MDMRSPARIGILAVTLAMGACVVTPTHEAMAVHDADAAMVSDCTFVGYVTGTSGWSGVAGDAGEANAQNEAREKAAKLGATDVVWQTVRSGWGSSANGEAYRCARGAE